jgi:mannan endo-1,4-beta-mannosidase
VSSDLLSAPPLPRAARSASPAVPTEHAAPAGPLPWISVAPGAPYFVTEHGEAWTPIGQNDAITWPELAGLFRRRDPAGVEAHLRRLREHGVTVLRLMLEYAHREHRYLERPVGTFQPNMVQLWDDLFAICERVGMRILLTPFDTFFTWIRWKKHPYNRANGGPCADRTQLLVCPATREAVKRRLEFATARWGRSGALFAWDLWNEFHPAQGDYRFDEFPGVIADLSRFLRETETRLHGRAHPQTVSVFGPELVNHPQLVDPILRHPELDFANSHFYEKGTIDNPRDTVVPAVSVGALTRAALAEIRDGRPFFDSEHGPIHAFKDRHRILPEPFDDEYFRHIQWAHLASGGAGGGMRWPNRHPHVLTAGMRRAQRGLAGFLPLVDWTRFRRRNLNAEITLSTPALAGFACGDEAQAVVWLLRRDTIGRDGRLRRDAAPIHAEVRVPGLASGRYVATAWDTEAGEPRGEWEAEATGGDGLLLRLPPFTTDLAVAVRR